MLLKLAVDSKQPLYGAGLKPALGKISKERAGLKPAPTLHRATILADKIILRRFQMPILQEMTGKMPVLPRPGQSRVLRGTSPPDRCGGSALLQLNDLTPFLT
jgi:hypothetical protein